MGTIVTPKNSLHSAWLTYKWARVMGNTRKEAALDALYEFIEWHFGG